FATWKREDLVRRFVAAGVPCGGVRTVAETLADPQLAARRMIATVHHTTAGDVRVLGTPIKLSETQGAVRSAPATLGEHTEKILREDVGLNSDEIRELREAGTV